MTATETKNQTNQVTLTIDGVSVTVPKGTTVYHAAEKIKVNIPIFCYQDRMPPFGACRMCLVEVEKFPKLQTSCTLEATEGMVVTTQSSKAVKGREDILEFLLINHPLDCPICDRGGECPLQEQTFTYGPGISRFFEEKRHFKKALPLGPVLMVDRERCIICARCTRFGDIVAGDHALEFKERGYRSEVGTPDSKPVDSKFIGNTIMICPVGALTSQVYRFRARPWDNFPTASTCTLCPVGCSMFFDSRDGEIMRTRSCENKDLNDIWMCDKGWFGYEFITSADRLQNPLIRKNGQLEEASWDEALTLIASKITEFKPAGKLAALGGNPLTTEENYLFQKLMRSGAGVNHIDHRIGLPVVSPANEGMAPGMEISIGECEKLSAALLLGLDLTEEFPVIWLRLKQGINHGTSVIFAGHYAPEIASHLKETIVHAPGNELEIIQQQLKTLKTDAKSAIFVGRQYLQSPNRTAILSELLNFCQSNENVSLNVMEGSGNSAGARFAGMRPDLGPVGSQVGKAGLDSSQLLEKAANEGWDYLHVAGANPAARVSSDLWKNLRSKLKFLVVQDIFLTETAKDADVVLPTLCYVEKGGSFINIEGRVQRLLPGKEIPQNLLSDGDIFSQIAAKLKTKLSIDANFIQALQSGHITLSRPTSISVQKPDQPSPANNQLRASFSRSLFDEGVRMKHNPHLIQLSKLPGARIHPKDAAKYHVNDEDAISIRSAAGAIQGKVKIDKGVSEGTIVLPLGFSELPVHELGNYLLNGMLIEIERLA
jgi:NADH-quinone oxidoreductase subunit G